MAASAVVLSGGGAKGAWQAGALKALHEKGELNSVRSVYGTSVGALNGCYPLIGMQELIGIWSNIKGTKDVLKKNCLISLLWKDGQYSTKPLEKLIDKHVKGKSNTNIIVCVTELHEGKAIYANSNLIPLDAFKKFVLASAAIPFSMESVEGKYVDGGVREQTPLQKAISDGHKEIIVVGTNPIMTNPAPWQKSGLKILSTGMRAVDIMSHEVFINDLNYCIKMHSNHNIQKYMPTKAYMDTLDFDPEKIRIAMDAGYNETKDRG